MGAGAREIPWPHTADHRLVVRFGLVEAEQQVAEQDSVNDIHRLLFSDISVHSFDLHIRRVLIKRRVKNRIFSYAKNVVFQCKSRRLRQRPVTAESITESFRLLPVACRPV